MKNKKAQMTLNNLPQIAVSLFVAAIIITIGAAILISMQDIQDDSLAAARNVTISWPGNNTKVGLGYSRINTGSVIVYNSSGNQLTLNTDYTVNSDDTITFTNTTAEIWDTDNINVTFQYYYGSYQRNATEYGVVGQDQLAQYIPTIALVAIAAIVIGIVIFMFGRTKPK